MNYFVEQWGFFIGIFVPTEFILLSGFMPVLSLKHTVRTLLNTCFLEDFTVMCESSETIYKVVAFPGHSVTKCKVYVRNKHDDSMGRGIMIINRAIYNTVMLAINYWNSSIMMLGCCTSCTACLLHINWVKWPISEPDWCATCWWCCILLLLSVLLKRAV